MFDIKEIMRFVPHRYPFLLIDRVVEFEKDSRAKVLKNVSINEAQFAGHFPGNPVFPGVYIIEHMAQASCFLLAKSSGELREDRVYVLGRINRASFLDPVTPGDQLVTSVAVEKQVGESAVIAARSHVDKKLVGKAELLFSLRKQG